MRDAEGRYLSSDVVDAVKFFLLEKGCKTVNDIPNITNIHLTKAFIKQNLLNLINQNLDILRYQNIG